MKRILFIITALIFTLTAYSQSARVIVDGSGEFVGIYVRTNASTYTVRPSYYGNETSDVPIAGNRLVTYSAEQGQGWLKNATRGTVNVRSTPSTSGKILGKLESEEGDEVPLYQCVGKVNGWYKIHLYDFTGYVRQDLMKWQPVAY